MDAEQLKAAAREKTLDQGMEPTSETVDLGDGVEVEVKAPPLDWEVNADSDTEASCEMVARCCYVPGTEERIFDRSDIEQMKSAPDEADGWISRLVGAVMRVRGLAPGQSQLKDRLDEVDGFCEEMISRLDNADEEIVDPEFADEVHNRIEEIRRLVEIANPGNAMTRG